MLAKQTYVLYEAAVERCLVRTKPRASRFEGWVSYVCHQNEAIYSRYNWFPHVQERLSSTLLCVGDGATDCSFAYVIMYVG